MSIHLFYFSKNQTKEKNWEFEERTSKILNSGFQLQVLLSSPQVDPEGLLPNVSYPLGESSVQSQHNLSH